MTPKLTPKEKAVELHSKYVYQICNYNGISESDSVLLCAKFCAFIAVDEMLAIEKKYSNFGEYEFLQEVKKEIEKL